ncbi:MAG: type 1 glutamine amidotransferase [bacterium]
MNSIRFALIQCRERDDPMCDHEVGCFVEALDISREQISTINLPYDPLSPELFDVTDMFLVGGSGDFSVLDKEPFLFGFFDFLNEICSQGFPMFASCFGFQALCHAVGGKITTDSKNAEVGSYQVSLTQDGKADPLFGSLPDCFFAQMGHKDRVVELPSTFVNLASSEKAPYQAFRVKDKPIYATQFHPELTKSQNRERFESYIKNYSNEKVGKSVQAIRESFRESSETHRLLPEFVKQFVSC